MSALPPEADMLIVCINVCYVPQADMKCPGKLFLVVADTANLIADLRIEGRFLERLI
jgi:hypothetical protein